MLKKWYTMKKKEIELKLTLYTAVLAFLESRKDMADLLQRLYLSLKDADPKELQNAIIEEIAKLVHEKSE